VGSSPPMRLPVNTVIHTTLVGLEPTTFRSLVRRATGSATEPRVSDKSCRHVELEQFWQAFASRGFVSDSWAFLLTSRSHAVYSHCFVVHSCSFTDNIQNRSRNIFATQFVCIKLHSSRLKFTETTAKSNKFRPGSIILHPGTVAIINNDIKNYLYYKVHCIVLSRDFFTLRIIPTSDFYASFILRLIRICSANLCTCYMHTYCSFCYILHVDGTKT